ncbi:MAG: 8-oxo-dGTP diphosphatase [Pseudonocardiales bacterium]|jgi:8-oxo-dGTP pyrophosphatase MutT (NUDIX family)|nr:8-oxo-dGTP diphosphatase [Pseudonocardiales bacterium]
MGSGDGWAICSAGHRHWGLFGAAGLLVIEGDQVILQHRSPWTHEGDRWGIPGGARDADETAVAAALREAREEAGLDPADIEPLGIYVSDHGGWSYSTVVAAARRPLRPAAYNAESLSVEWVRLDDVAHLPLHDGFAEAWPHLQDIGAPVHALIGPAVADSPVLAALTEAGVEARRLPTGMRSGSLHRVLLRVEPVGNATEAASRVASLPEGTQVIVVLESADLALLG